MNTLSPRRPPPAPSNGWIAAPTTKPDEPAPTARPPVTHVQPGARRKAKPDAAAEWLRAQGEQFRDRAEPTIRERRTAAAWAQMAAQAELVERLDESPVYRVEDQTEEAAKAERLREQARGDAPRVRQYIAEHPGATRGEIGGALHLPWQRVALAAELLHDVEIRHEPHGKQTWHRHHLTSSVVAMPKPDGDRRLSDALTAAVKRERGMHFLPADARADVIDAATLEALAPGEALSTEPAAIVHRVRMAASRRLKASHVRPCA